MHIKINTAEYRTWKIYQNKKNLIRRTKRKAAIRARRTAQIISHQEKHVYAEPFHAPEIFSFIENPNGTTSFFEKLTTFIIKKENFGQELFIDISQVKILTIDALMYLLAIVNNLNRKFQHRYSFRGNFPQDQKIRNLIRNSGFYKFVRYNGIDPIARDVDNIQIVSGDKVNTKLAKKICDFVLSKGNMQKSTTAFLYNMMIELMANVYAHAYNGMSSDILHSLWYCFAEYDDIYNTVCFSFMDTGAGIPSTVRKHGLEHIDFLNLTGDGPYILSALKGELRSKTKEPYRGKGLPKIFEYCQRGLIQNMRIITNKGDVEIIDMASTSEELTSSLKGTLFYWQINLSDLGGRL